jgi:hypothetical protein
VVVVQAAQEIVHLLQEKVLMELQILVVAEEEQDLLELDSHQETVAQESL